MEPWNQIGYLCPVYTASKAERQHSLASKAHIIAAFLEQDMNTKNLNTEQTILNLNEWCGPLNSCIFGHTITSVFVVVSFNGAIS